MDLGKLNSATKYPSIPTYHEMDRGTLSEPAIEFDGSVICTEKVDGTNGRIVLMPDGDYYIGSREELLHARGDRVINPAQGIVAALKPIADRLIGGEGERHHLHVFYLEVYGHKIGAAAKQYTRAGQVGARMFDLAFIEPATLDWDAERIASWRDGGGQRFAREATLLRASEEENIPIVPRLVSLYGSDLPDTIEMTHDWLKLHLPYTRVALDGAGESEGIVLRSPDRKTIAKARFEDYERTAKRAAQGKR